MPRQHGISATTASRLILDSGAAYLNYDEVSQALLGATRGGATFNIEQEIREVELDGAKGPIVGLRRVTRAMPKMTFTVMEVSLAHVLRQIPGSASAAAAPYDVITRQINVVPTSAFITNFALAAEYSGTTNPVVIKVQNALFDGAFSLTTVDKDEGTMPTDVTGHYSGADLETEPWEIRWPQS